MGNEKKIIFCLSGLFLFIATVSSAQESIPSGSQASPDINLPHSDQQQNLPVERVSDGIFHIGEIQINKEAKSISFPAVVNMDKGLLEYLLVHQAGKTHESLFRTNVKPYNLQVAFLLLGFKITDRPLPYQGAPEQPKGDPLEITITYGEKENRKTTIHPEEWIVKIKENKQENSGTINWVFTGSKIVDGVFLAERDGSIIAVYHDPVALADNASTGGESDKIWYVKEGAVPSTGTPVTITISAIK